MPSHSLRWWQRRRSRRGSSPRRRSNALQRVEPHLDALVLECFDRALAGADALPNVRGVPTLIKDMSDLSGFPTRWGSGALADAGPADHDAPEVAQLIAMGMNVLGKTSLPEFGIICSAEFPDATPTRNPWNTDHTPGGSSSGSRRAGRGGGRSDRRTRRTAAGRSAFLLRRAVWWA